MERKPKGTWEGSGDPTSREGCAWWNRLDGRYLIEVQYGDEELVMPRTDGLTDEFGTLCVFDHEDNDKLVFEQPTTILEGARFGPDVRDITRWQEIVLTFVDGLEAE